MKDSLRSVIFGVSLASLIFLLQNVAPHLVHKKIWPLFIFMYILFQIGHQLSVRKSTQDPTEGTVRFMIGLGFRFLFSLGIFVLFVVKGVENKVLLGGDFVALYFAFTSFEIYALISNLRPKLKRQEEK